MTLCSWEDSLFWDTRRRKETKFASKTYNCAHARLYKCVRIRARLSCLKHCWHSELGCRCFSTFVLFETSQSKRLQKHKINITEQGHRESLLLCCGETLKNNYHLNSACRHPHQKSRDTLTYPGDSTAGDVLEEGVCLLFALRSWKIQLIQVWRIIVTSATKWVYHTLRESQAPSGKRWQETEIREEWCWPASSGYDRTTELRSWKQVWLPTQDPYKVKPS